MKSGATRDPADFQSMSGPLQHEKSDRFARAASIADAILPWQRLQLFSGCSRTMTSLTRDGAAAFARGRRFLVDDPSTRSGCRNYRPLSVAGALAPPTTSYRPQEHRPSSSERHATGLAPVCPQTLRPVESVRSEDCLVQTWGSRNTKSSTSSSY